MLNFAQRLILGCVLLAGITIFIQALGHANEAGELPPDAPRWMRFAQFLIVLTLFACFALMGSWVAFGPGERHFSGTFGGGATVGRIAFGIGAIIAWLSTILVAVYGWRRIMRVKSGA